MRVPHHEEWISIRPSHLVICTGVWGWLQIWVPPSRLVICTGAWGWLRIWVPPSHVRISSCVRGHLWILVSWTTGDRKMMTEYPIIDLHMRDEFP